MRLNVEQQAQWNGDQISAAVGPAAAAGLTAAAHRLRAISVPLAPIDQGPLRESATVTPAAGGDTPVAAVSYDTPYAVIQHERTDFNHSVGQAKYLEGPLRSHRAELVGIIRDHLRKAFRSGI